jgi:hypothetical protein
MDKLDNIMASLRVFKGYMDEVRLRNQESVPSLDEIESLVQQVSQLSLSQEVVAREQAILRSLSFETRPIRHTAIPEAYCKTFQWVYTPGDEVPASATHLASWLKSGSGIFWVSGKPGSGKSTFLKFIANEPRTRELLKEWSGEEETIIASHYFWRPGTVIQKSEEGLLRTLIYDIFRQCSEFIIPLCGDRRPNPVENNEATLQAWTLPELYAILNKFPTLAARNIRFCFFIDGLDEYAGDHFNICRVLADLARSPNIKICLSSRPWNVFEEAFGSDVQNKLYIQDLTRKDILEYIQFRLYEHPRWSSLETRASQGEALVKEIENRASGVFLWVFLVTRQLRNGLTNRDSFSDLCRRLQSIPIELEVFFQQILESVEPFYHEKMSTTLQMTIAAEEPLHAMAYDFHDQDYDDANSVFDVPIRPFTQEELAELQEKTVWRLESRSRGLLEMNPLSNTVTFLHRTVFDFLNTSDMSQYLADKAPAGFLLPQIMLKVYTAMLKRSNIKDEERRQEFGLYTGGQLSYLTSKALACTAEIEMSLPASASLHTLSPVVAGTYKILDEFDRSLLVLLGFPLSNGTRQAFFREQLITRELSGFLRWKMRQTSTYMTGLDPFLIPRTLSPKCGILHLGQVMPWRGRGIEMLREMLETQELNLNAQCYNMNPRLQQTAWTIIITHITSWPQGTREIEDRFWALLESGIVSTMLRKGADPNATIWRDDKEARSALGAYLELAFKITADVAHEALYIRVLGDFILYGAILDSSHSVAVNQTMRRSLGSLITVLSPSQCFFNRLRTMHVAERCTTNFRLLHAVFDVLVSTVNDQRLYSLKPLIRTSLEVGFPEDASERFISKYPHIFRSEDHRVDKRKACTEINKDNIKVSRT